MLDRATRRAALLALSFSFADPSTARAEEPSAPARAPHPEPRVIVNVTSVSGPHARREVERAAREGWGKIVKCYESIDRKARGLVGVEFAIEKSGKVSQVRHTRSTLKNSALSRCLADALLTLTMPTAERRSTANAEIRVAPGDPP